MTTAFRLSNLFLALALLPASWLVAQALPGQTQPTPATPPQKPGFRPPVTVSDLLDVCGAALEEIDSHPKQVVAVNLVKFGWCLGWVQGLEERIIEVRLASRVEMMTTAKDGQKSPLNGWPDKDYMSICLPNDVRPVDLIRAIVKELPASPYGLQEPKNGPVKAALKKAYPCPAAAKEGS